jgi:cytoskeletal protein CcmA (bactofilin family)
MRSSLVSEVSAQGIIEFVLVAGVFALVGLTIFSFYVDIADTNTYSIGKKYNSIADELRSELDKELPINSKTTDSVSPTPKYDEINGEDNDYDAGNNDDRDIEEYEDSWDNLPLLFGKEWLNLAGTPEIYGDAHSNGNLNAAGNPLITGRVSAVGRIFAIGKPQFMGDYAEGVAELEFPTITMMLEDIPEYTTINGPLIRIGTTELEGVYYVKGSVMVSGNIAWHTTIIAEGDIMISGNMDFSAYENPIQLYTPRTIHISGRGVFKGKILAGDIRVSGTPEFH